ADLPAEFIMPVETSAQHQLPAFTKRHLVLHEKRIMILRFFSDTIHIRVFQAFSPELTADSQSMNGIERKTCLSIKDRIDKTVGATRIVAIAAPYLPVKGAAIQSGAGAP